MVRATLSELWPESAENAEFRILMNELAACERALLVMADGPLGQQLHDSRCWLPESLHRRVVIPLRRDIHNGRAPRPVLREAAAELADRLPLLENWLRLVDRRERLRAELATARTEALKAERGALSLRARDETLRRAVALSSVDLLHGLADVAGPGYGAKARKAEVKVLRYALRAATKTSPWSWFTAVGWGTWDEPGAGITGEIDPVAHVLPNQTLVSALLRALLTEPALRWSLPHRAAPALGLGADRFTCLRDDCEVKGNYVAVREQRVSLPRTRTLDVVLAEVRAAGAKGRTLPELAAVLGGMLASEAPVKAYLDRLADEQVLLPIAPIDPQLPDPLPAMARWLESAGWETLAGQLRRLHRGGLDLACLPAGRRPQAIRDLDAGWTAAFDGIGAARPKTMPVREDVLLPGRLRLGAEVGADIRADLSRLAPLTELVNEGAVLRALARHRMLSRFGDGGRCRVADLVGDAEQLWAAAMGVGADGAVSLPDGETLPDEVAEIAALRREITETTQAAFGGGQEAWLSEELLDHVTGRLPRWMLRRPASYSHFVQPFDEAGRRGWCLNSISTGWGRFTTRFLDAFGPELRDAVAARLARTLDGELTAQFRPVNGFNANLHPLLTGTEVGEDPAWSALLDQDLEVVHDPVTGLVRLHVAATGAPINVLYLGFLVQLALPDRVAAYYLDLTADRAVFGRLAPAETITPDVRRRARLRHRDLVLARRSWAVGAETAGDWARTLATGEAVDAVARWRAALDLPEAVFVAGVRQQAAEDEKPRLTAPPKPQFVDFGNALHLRCLAKLLQQHDGPVHLTEALPAPGSGRALELIVETHRRGM
ncbi:lantibiotic dehydratase [Amycolatopsis sp. cg5]|uniref:lantibiotic dehydratase n=1 Tax=Amycolatopsis sp. cg5 TaxID=3238802 RepID=UPI003523292B